MDEFFGNFLKTEDIKKEIQAIIQTIKPEKIGKGENQQEKIIAYFTGIEKGLVLNKVNSEAIAEITGSREIEEWTGAEVILYVDPNVMFGGKRVGGIRIKKTEETTEKEEKTALIV